MRRLLIAVLAVVVPWAGAATAGAAGSTWRVVEATHSSTATAATPDASARGELSVASPGDVPHAG